MTMVKVIVVVVMMISILFSMPKCLQAINIGQLRHLINRKNMTCILVFGDSSVDPGNNNFLATTLKSNFPPYGKDFFDSRPTGRFCNGRLATDFIAEALGHTKIISGFLDRHLTQENLLHGVSFASAGSGYDYLTANFSNVLSFSRQIKYFMHYKLHLGRLVGEKKAEEIIQHAIYILSMGTNDFVQNYFLEPTRPKQYSLEGYLNYLATCITNDIKTLHRLGAMQFVLVGVPPLGCMPLVKTLTGTTGCADSYNKASFSFNSKVRNLLTDIGTSLGVKTAYVDTYAIFERTMSNPTRYGFTETSKGCCGSGTIEVGETCRGMSTCKDPSKYIFWDSVHPTEHMYRIIANEALRTVSQKILA
ncbi:PREDICTED: GDSL esterase/lipase At5g45950-like [Nelumbo nucifera]|uniref:GDSL esterase/lipase At5g45950-like n=2 Tax=Nelumbo nucifera TaxID=4432 RepID=A0A1U8BGB0_NELNU|nr:PREDICTED: GDSL esterase/lipase At5g45950-like [Nelumbo nucifera]DAD21127.1 TPA_asm: hypothetical protein HUJ06_022590 [Nelumbo nucifera]